MPNTALRGGCASFYLNGMFWPKSALFKGNACLESKQIFHLRHADLDVWPTANGLDTENIRRARGRARAYGAFCFISFSPPAKPGHLFWEDAQIKFPPASSPTWRQRGQQALSAERLSPFFFPSLPLPLTLMPLALKFYRHFGHFLDSCHFLSPFLPFSSSLLPYYTFKLRICLAGYKVTASSLHRTFLRAQTIPLQAYTLLCKNTHWPAHCVYGCRPPGLIFTRLPNTPYSRSNYWHT